MASSTRLSQRSSITQRIGTTDVTIVYHSPSVQGRKIFGGVVPYDFMVDEKEYPWRAGSNRNTTIEFTHDVRVGGKALSAGTYGLHVFVSKKEWTFIFSKNFKSWGSFQYKKSEDALRVKVETQKVPHQEWLSYSFVDREAESAGVALRWEKTSAQFKIEVDVTAQIIADLLAKEEKTGGDYLTLARQTLEKDPSNTKQAMEWVEKSIEKEETFHNKMFKAELLARIGNQEQGESLKKAAL